ncbi:MAG: T9SS type A sorting domain-containing protein [Bacteroidales bacterium]|jgi:hypothetical protein|nr:T9SS type A sorting domain-containing protein [Bacteroidales bacterium]
MKKRIVTSLFIGLLFHGVILANPASTDDIRQYSNLTASTTVITPGGSFSVSVNIVNYGSNNFSGSLTAVVFSMPSGQAIDFMETQSISLSPATYTACTFNTSGIPDMTSGSYLVQIFHQPAEEEGEWVVLAANGHTNYVIITVADPYEVNNTVSQAYNLPVSFSNNMATVQTTGSTFHNSTDIDYYKIVLPAGYNYSLSGRLHDSYSSTAGTFTVDAKVAHSLNGSSWTPDYDTYIIGENTTFSVAGGNIIYFRVRSYASGDTGTYLLNLNITRNAYDIRLHSNPAASPAAITPGSPFSVNVSIGNYGSNNFNGSFAAIIFNDLTGEFVDFMDTISTPLASEYFVEIPFTTSGIDAMTPGDYIVQFIYRSAADEDWFPVAPNGFTNFVTITVAIPSLSQFSNATVAPASIAQGAPFSANVRITNNSEVNFSGELKAVVYNTVGIPIADMEILTTSLLGGYSSIFTFNTSGIDAMGVGSYDIRFLYRPTAGSDWVFVTSGSYSAGHISVIAADPYEVNNTVSQAYLLPVSSSGNTLTAKTPGSNFHNSTDIDYYKIVLPDNGYNYTISGYLYDSYTSTYTVNAKVAYSTNGGSSWSVDYDSYTSNTSVLGGDTVCFRVQPSSSGAMGTYLLTIAMTRESLTSDRYETNNTGGEAYQLPVSFSGRTATVQTYGSNIHNAADMDYYKIVLPSGNNYAVSGQLHDANNSLFTLDAKVAYSIDNGNSWSEYQDTYIVANGGSLTIINGGEILFRVKANNDGETGTYLLEINVLQTTGIAEATKEHSFTVYPNPAKDYVVFDFSKIQIPVTHITVSDAQGRILTNTAVNTPSQITVTVKDWATGLYFIQCQTGEGVITRKFMVK